MSVEIPHYIQFSHVYKTFDKPVLVDVSFSVDPGETLAIIGRSGVGKSVSLGHIMGFLKPDSGDVYVGHRRINDLDESELRKIRKKVTMVFQSGALFDSMTVEENVLFSLELRDDYDEENKDEIVKGLLEMVGLEEYGESYPNDLSTGHRRAVAIARALAAQPDCILYDEPTTGLDPVTSAIIDDLMVRMQRQLGVTGIVITHDMRSAYTVGTRIAMLYQGRVRQVGTVDEIRHSTDPIVRQFIEGRPVLDAPAAAHR